MVTKNTAATLFTLLCLLATHTYLSHTAAELAPMPSASEKYGESRYGELPTDTPESIDAFVRAFEHENAASAVKLLAFDAITPNVATTVILNNFPEWTNQQDSIMNLARWLGTDEKAKKLSGYMQTLHSLTRQSPSQMDTKRIAQLATRIHNMAIALEKIEEEKIRKLTPEQQRQRFSIRYCITLWANEAEKILKNAGQEFFQRLEEPQTPRGTRTTREFIRQSPLSSTRARQLIPVIPETPRGGRVSPLILPAPAIVAPEPEIELEGPVGPDVSPASPASNIPPMTPRSTREFLKRSF